MCARGFGNFHLAISAREWRMGEGGGYQEDGDARRCALGDVTNLGKRGLILDSKKIFSGEGIDENSQANVDDSFVEERAFKKWKTDIDGKTEALVDIKGKGLFSSEAKEAGWPMTPNIIGNFVQRNIESDLVSLQKSSDSLANETVGKLGSGFISTEPVLVQCDKLFVTDSEEDFSDGHETDSAGSTRYSFQSKEVENCSTALKSPGLDFTTLKEGNVHGCEGPWKFQKTSGSSKGSMDSGVNESSSVPSCGKVGMLEESCKCPFCLKAAYIWADLNYQDTRARLAELKKSRRLAKSLEARSCSNKSSTKAARRISDTSASLESELTQQWRSLFLCTENIVAREAFELHDKFLRLKELKENCKRDLEKNSLVPS
ncbi:uncharacterized protein LOC122019947 isoform X1 [Zingiber officinale]|nr:uncharacterized protein LOC122019947 isoform X1 [Zingiber officinale]